MTPHTHLHTHAHTFLNTFIADDIRVHSVEGWFPYVPHGGQRRRKLKCSREQKKTKNEQEEEDKASPESDMSSQYGVSNS